MPNTTYIPITGVIRSITPFSGECCSQFISLSTDNGMINFISSPETYIINNTFLLPRMRITAFYDPNQPVPLIFPPQYRAVLISLASHQEQIAYGFFHRNLVAADNSLKLNIGPLTDVVTKNGQRFHCAIGGRELIVFYTNTTRSIPPQTTPRKIIVAC